MLRINLQRLTADVYARLKSDPAGASVRALLGAQAVSIIHAQKLAAPHPAPVFLALRRLGAPSLPGGPHQVTFQWWAYDLPAQGYYRLNGLLLPLARAYDGFRSAGAPVSDVDVVAGDEREDKTLKLLAIPVTLTLFC